MVRIGIRAKTRDGNFVDEKISVSKDIYKVDNDSLYGIISDYLDEKHGDIFKWFRFWTF